MTTVNCKPHNRLVVGSNPTEPTKVAVLSEELDYLPLRELVETLLGEEGEKASVVYSIGGDFQPTSPREVQAPTAIPPVERYIRLQIDINISSHRPIKIIARL